MFTPPSVTYDEAEFNKRYEELKQYKVTIPADPIGLGFRGLCELVAQVQSYKSRVNELQQEAVRLKSQAKVQASAAEYAYEAALDIAIDTDNEVKMQTSDRTRVAVANKKLKPQIERMRETSMIVTLVDAYHKTVANVYDNLESTNRNLTEQCNLYKRSLPPTDAQPYTGRYVPTSL